MKKLLPHVIATNIFGTVGYLLTVFSWVLVGSFVVLLMMDSGVSISPPEATASMLFMRHLQTPEFIVGMSYVTAVVMLVVTVATFIALPYLIGFWSARGMRMVLRIAKMPLTLRHLFFAKSSIAVIPLLAFLLYQLIMQPEAMLFSVLYVTVLIVTIIALVCFTVQLLLARYLRVDSKKIW